MRDMLFGDVPMEEWPEGDPAHEPLASFVRARRAAEEGDRAAAVEIWRRITATPELEARHYLQAWHFLRDSGVQPDETVAKRLHGVVIEVPVGSGLDLLAAYSDRTARYFNHAGAAVVWDRPDDRLDSTIDALLEAGERVVARIGPWEGERPDPPGAGRIRLNLLTPSGLHLGEAPFDALAADPLGGPVVSAGLVLMQALMEPMESAE